MKITKTIIIKAKPEKVFTVVTDFAAYSGWNPWLVKAEGICKEGEDVVVNALVRGKIQQYHHKILEVTPSSVFHWCDKGWFTVFAYGDRKRILKPHPEGTEYTVILNVTGPLAFLVKWLFGASLEQGMSGETDALKVFVEST